jgi:hypothetical protein
MRATVRFLILFLLPIFTLGIGTNKTEAQWVQVAGGSALKIVADGSYIYAGLDGGIYVPGDTTLTRNIIRSSDNGESWVNISNGLFSPTKYSLTVMTLAIKAPFLFAGTDNGIFLSINNGDSWTQTSFDPRLGSVNCLLVKDSIVFAGIGREPITEGFEVIYDTGGVFLSMNNGGSWTPVDSGLEVPSTPGTPRPPYLPIFALATNGSSIYAGAIGGGEIIPNGGIYRSTNDGSMWTRLGLQIGVSSITFVGTTIFAVPSSAGGVFWSKDNGVSWNGSNPGYYAISFAARGGISFWGHQLEACFILSTVQQRGPL